MTILRYLSEGGLLRPQRLQVIAKGGLGWGFVGGSFTCIRWKSNSGQERGMASNVKKRTLFNVREKMRLRFGMSVTFQARGANCGKKIAGQML